MKRKTTEKYSVSKKRFLESLEDLGNTPPKKKINNKKLQNIKQNKPEEIFQEIFSKKERLSSSGLSLKHKSKVKEIQADISKEDYEKPEALPRLGEVFSKLASIPERKAEFIDSPRTSKASPMLPFESMTETISIDGNLPSTIQNPLCCTPATKIIIIPESYRRQKATKCKQRIESHNT